MRLLLHLRLPGARGPFSAYMRMRWTIPCDRTPSVVVGSTSGCRPTGLSLRTEARSLCSSGWIRTSNHPINSRALYPLSYQGIAPVAGLDSGQGKPNTHRLWHLSVTPSSLPLARSTGFRWLGSEKFRCQSYPKGLTLRQVVYYSRSAEMIQATPADLANFAHPEHIGAVTYRVAPFNSAQDARSRALASACVDQHSS